ncbi:hypothetical protein TH5_09025 [Thalassospira xianhensis MCCC 1A02616]|uniref:Uncharacterized protein n=2 Tax=Thalassospira xianhensis TaxID=478503 RepID=A0A367UF81_9PROT|nr:hypothetical protein TH5_09025 [Thalassospira xianhensis MCCC 1A02616]
MIHSMKLACTGVLLLCVSMLLLWATMPAKAVVVVDPLAVPTDMFEISLAIDKPDAKVVTSGNTVLYIFKDRSAHALIWQNSEREYVSRTETTISDSLEGGSKTIKTKDVLKTGMEMHATYHPNDKQINVQLGVTFAKFNKFGEGDAEIEVPDITTQVHNLRFSYDELLSEPSITKVIDEGKITVTVKRLLGGESD